MVLRTLVINLGFLVPLLYFFPKPSFRALATRGDWFLEHLQPKIAGPARSYLFSGVDKLNWIYAMALNNPYERYQDEDPPPPPPTPTAASTPIPDKAKPQGELQSKKSWPQPLGLHPIVRSMPAHLLADYPSVAKYIASKLHTEREQIKAIHDFVIWHLSYDYAALERHEYPDQHAAAVFASKKAVCAGYARLMSDMGKELGLDVRYITGDSRKPDGQLEDSGHAWNAANIDGQWYLIDATWNDQDHRKHPDRTRNEGYETTYFLAPPQAFLLNHFPKDPRWQLMPIPMNLQDFLRQPSLEPEFVAAEMSLQNPNLRSQVQSDTSRWSFVILNPGRHTILAHIKPKDASEDSDQEQVPCRVSGTSTVTVDCPLASDTSILEFYGGPPDVDGSYPHLGQFEVHYR